MGWAGADSGRESLQEVADYASAEAIKAIDWYLRKKANKRTYAQGLRLLAIGATALAGLIPLAVAIHDSGGARSISPAWCRGNRLLRTPP